MPHTNVDCVSDGQNDCFIAHIGHIMPSDSDASSSDMSMLCDHCSTACQPLLIAHHLVGLIQEAHSIFDTQFIDSPCFSRRIHDDYVDSVRFVGDYILSKSTNNQALLWKPEGPVS